MLAVGFDIFLYGTVANIGDAYPMEVKAYEPDNPFLRI